MTMQYYLFSMAFYLLGGFCLYFCLGKVLPVMASRRTAARISLATSSLLTLGGLVLATFAFLYV